MNTKQAFEMVIKNRDCHKKTGLSYSDISIFRAWLDGKRKTKPSIEKMEQVISKYGLTKTIEEKWS